jgi:hypothetical protein
MEIDRPLQRTVGGLTIHSPYLTSHISDINEIFHNLRSAALPSDASVVGPPTFLIFREINFILAL